MLNWRMPLCKSWFLLSCWPPFFYTSVFVYALIAMAGIQCLSALFWSLFFTSETPQMKAGRFIRRAFIVTMLILLLSWLLQNGAVIFGVLYLMIFAGPVLGFSYFFITLREISFYRKARKPYYLL